MSEIVLFLPGNLFHSNVTQKKMERLLNEKAGMRILCDSKVPVVFGWQMMDWQLAPDIYNPGPHELCDGSYSHILHSLLPDDDEESGWQMDNGINADWKKEEGFNSVNVTFFPEFVPPRNPDRIKTDYFFLLGPYTRYYNNIETIGELAVREEVSKIQAIKFDDKIGILIGNSNSPIRDKWHKYQTNPGKGLGPLVDATKKVAEQSSPVHIALWDLETPYVGSDSNAEYLWLDYFEALEKAGVVFSPLGRHLEWFKKRAVDVEAPHRLLSKWTTHDIQLDYIRRAYNDIRAKTLRATENLNKAQQRALLAIARSSDVLSAMDSRILKQEKERPSHVKENRGELLKLGAACLNILEGKEGSLESLSKADPILGPQLVKILRPVQ